MKALELLTTAKNKAAAAMESLHIMRHQAALNGKVEQDLLYQTLKDLSAANCALQSFECLVRTGEQPKSGE